MEHVHAAAGEGGIREVLQAIFANQQFMPHGHCYYWTPSLLWTHFGTDLLIGAAYLSISVTLWWLVRRINLPFHSMFLAFGLFIAACGATHFMNVWTLWTPNYWLSAFVKLVTALASVATGVLLFPLLPKVESLVRSAQLAEARREELLEKNRELEQLYARVRELDEAKTRFFANVSHELRTPLALILGPAERLHAEAVTERDKRDLAVIERNARTLLKHVNDLLGVAQLEAASLSAEYARVDLAELLRLVAAHFETVAEQRQVALVREFPAGLPAELDPDKVERVALNLLSNAFKFAPEGGRVRISLHREAERAVIEVADSGPGVPPAQRAEIFGRFHVGSGHAGGSLGGIGLGLTIARDFAELHGGSLQVDDAPEGGALFRLELPLQAPTAAPVRDRTAPSRDDLARQVVATAEVAEQVAPLASERAGAADLPVVLVVEDNDDLRRFICETLAADCAVVTAPDGAEGLQKALELLPDLVLSDVMMPRMSGDEMVRQARGHEELDGTPFVLLTAREDDELRVRMLQAGAQDYLVKPFSVEELRARVSNLLSMKRARDLLQVELASKSGSLEELAVEMGRRKRELQTALDSVEVARHEAESASLAKSRFLGLVSHELRTPLAGIELYLEALRRRGGLDGKQAALVEKIGVAAERMQQLVESLLERVRIESGRLVVAIERIDLASLGAAAIEEMAPQAEAKALQLRYVRPEGLPPLHGDERLVRLILVNLLGNAIKFTEQGQVELLLEREAEGFRLEVQDTGPGIARDQLERIFDPFVQLEPLEHKHKPGFGLGLALVKTMVDALGGRIEVASEVGRGSVFTVVLPERP